MVDLTTKTMLVSVCHALCLLTPLSAAETGTKRLMLWTDNERQLSKGLVRDIRAELTELVGPGFSGVDFRTATDWAISTSESVVLVWFRASCGIESELRINALFAWPI